MPLLAILLVSSKSQASNALCDGQPRRIFLVKERRLGSTGELCRHSRRSPSDSPSTVPLMRRAAVLARRAIAPALQRGPLASTPELLQPGLLLPRGPSLVPTSLPAATFSSSGKPRKPGVASDAEMDSFLEANSREDIVVVDARNTDFSLEPDDARWDEASGAPMASCGTAARPRACNTPWGARWV